MMTKEEMLAHPGISAALKHQMEVENECETIDRALRTEARNESRSLPTPVFHARTNRRAQVRWHMEKRKATAHAAYSEAIAAAFVEKAAKQEREAEEQFLAPIDGPGF